MSVSSIHAAPDEPTDALRAVGKPDGPAPRVAVLIGVYNGERFIEEQIETLARQDVERVDLWFSDDGSTDRTRDIVEDTKSRWTKGEVHLLKGPGRGFAENFRSLLVCPDVDADYLALCDQDDLWDADKLSAALAWIDAEAGGAPALHCSRTRIIAQDGTQTGYSPLFRHAPDFRNAMVQNIAGGNTMVMNRAAHRLLREASRNVTFVSHDWWCYLFLTGIGGHVHYSPDARTSYRQHDRNVMGEKSSLRARIARLRMIGKGRFRSWNATNLAALGACRELLTHDARRTVDLYARAREGRLLERLAALRRSGVYRQTLAEQIGLYAACVLKRI
mgnify:CR=1 FL=1